MAASLAIAMPTHFASMGIVVRGTFLVTATKPQAKRNHSAPAKPLIKDFQLKSDMADRHRCQCPHGRCVYAKENFSEFCYFCNPAAAACCCSCVGCDGSSKEATATQTDEEWDFPVPNYIVPEEGRRNDLPQPWSAIAMATCEPQAFGNATDMEAANVDSRTWNFYGSEDQTACGTATMQAATQTDVWAPSPFACCWI